MIDWIAVGLGLNFIGALFFGVKGARFVKYPVVGRIASAKDKTIALERLFTEHHVDPGTTASRHLLATIDRKSSLELPDEPAAISIVYRDETGAVVTVETDTDTDTTAAVGAPNLVRSWVESEIQHSSRWSLRPQGASEASE